MSVEKTFCIIKPNATENNVIGKIMTHFEENDLRIAACKMKKLSKEEAEGFYIEHKDQPFFAGLISFMTSGPVVLMVLEGANAVFHARELMGSTNPVDAAAGTIRKLYARSMQQNAVHGSDSLTSATREIAYFFDKSEVISRN